MMNRVAVLGLLAGMIVARGDVLHLTTGQEMRGRVVSFADMNFEVRSEGHNSVRLSSAAVKTINFEGALARLETRTRGELEGTVTRYEKGGFILQTKNGKTEQISVAMVKSATFGGAGKDIEQVRGGDLEKYLARGQVTIVDFYADWCGPCRFIAPHLEKLAKDDDEVVLRKVNVDQNQALARKYGVRGIPHILIYDKQGNLAGTVVGASRDQVEQHVRQAKARRQ